MADGALTFTTAVRVVVRVHNRAADGGTDTEVSGLARFTDAHDFVFEIAYLTDSSPALERNESHFARRHLNGSVRAFFSHNLVFPRRLW